MFTVNIFGKKREMYLEIHPIRATVGKAVTYISKDEKTENGTLCNASSIAANSWNIIRESHSANSGVLAYHVILSFNPELKVSKDEAMKITRDFAEQNFDGRNFNSVYAVHTDTDIIHSHIIFNSVNSVTGRKYVDSFAELKNLRESVISCCRKYGIEESFSKKNNSRDLEYKQTSAYKRWNDRVFNNRSKIREDINAAISISSSFDDFISKMKDNGYSVKYLSSRGQELKYISFKRPGGDRYIRDRTLGTSFSKTAITNRIEKRAIVREIADYNKQRKKWKNRNTRTIYKNSRNIRRGFLPCSFYSYKSYNGKIKINRVFNELKRLNSMYNTKFKQISNMSIGNPQRNSANMEIRNVMSQIEYMRNHRISKMSDIDYIKESLKTQIGEIDESFVNLNVRYSELDSLIKKFEQVQIHKEVYEDYSRLIGSERREFYDKYRDELDEYQIALRELKIKGYTAESINEHIDTLEYLEKRVDELIECRNRLQEEYEEAERFKEYISSVEKKEKEKNSLEEIPL